jgi:uncharacterized repeat protein (TIGR01451 family)
MALAPTSPAIDAGVSNGLPFDQRGAPFSRVRGAAADIGAFEYQPAFLAPTVEKSFTPDTITAGDISTLTITLTNPNADGATLQASLVDMLPSPVVIADADAASTCAGAVVSAVVGDASVTLDGGAQIPGSGSCTVTVSVKADAAGSYVNTIPAGALQTDEGSNADPGSADLTVTEGSPPDQIFKDGFD